MTDAIVPLVRTFSPWRADPDFTSYFRDETDTRDWRGLFEVNRVVVLAEAGAGKSTELERCERQLRQDGRTVFRATVQDLGKGLSGALSPTAARQLEAWKGGEQVAWFLIDAADEGPLVDIHLPQAVRALAYAIDGAERRAHIILTSRFTDWDAVEDLKVFDEALSLSEQDLPPPPTEAQLLGAILDHVELPPAPERTPPTVVIMDPLDTEQVRQFASQRLGAQAEPFLAAVEADDLWRFVRRPLDLGWMIEHWQTHQALGPLAQMIQASLDARLSETNRQHKRQDGLDVERCKAALERLGAALVFGQAQTLGLAGAPSAPDEAAESLDVAAVLPDWSADAVSKLLHRPVFEPATFGRSRLHNDNTGDVRSYLAARWLQRRRRAGCDYPTLRDLLFADLYGQAIVRDGAGDIAAWLSLWDEDVAREVVARQPALLVAAGDPSSLPLATRIAVLDALIEHLKQDQTHRRALFDHDKLKRFSGPDLAEAIRRQWMANGDVAQVRTALLMMIWLGRIAACVDLVAPIALDPGAERVDQVFAARALAQLGDAQGRARLAGHVRANLATLPASAVWDAIENLFPGDLGVDDLLAATRQAQEGDGFGFRRIAPDLVKRLDAPADLETLLAGVVAIAQSVGEPDVGAYPRPRETFGPTLVNAALRLLERTPETQAPEGVVQAMTWLAKGHGVRDLRRHQAVRDELNRTSTRRRSVYWLCATLLSPLAQRHQQTLNAHFQLEYYGWPGALKLADLDWLLVDMLDREDPEQRRLALSSALAIWKEEGQAPQVLERLKAQAAKDEALKTFLDLWLIPHEPDEEHRKLLARMEASKAKAEKQDAKRRRSWEVFLDKMRADVSILQDLAPREDGKADTRLYNIWLLARGLAAKDGWAFNDLGPALPLLGDALAQAFRSAITRFWRAWTPTLRSSREPGKRNLFSELDAMALTGVHLEAAGGPGWTHRLSPQDAERAAELATLDMVRLPPWLSDLLPGFSDIVGRVLAHEVEAELDYAGEDRAAVLYALARAEPPVRACAAGRLLPVLVAHPDLEDDKLSDFLTILAAASPDVQAKVEAVVRDRADTAAPDRAAPYLAFLFTRAPEDTVERLQRRLQALSPAEQTTLSSNFLPGIFGHAMFTPHDPAPAVRFPVLLSLVKVAYATIRIADDINHPSGVVFTRGPRDAAQDSRYAVLHHLASTPGQATYDTLLALAASGEIDIDPDWLTDLARKRRVEDSRLRRWAPGQARDFEQDRELAPRMSDELQGLIVRRIAEIAHDLLHGDFNRGRAFKREPDETGVQNWIAARLRDLQRQSYSLEREAHRAAEKKPDIVVRATRADASLAIEIKVVDDLSVLQLEQALTQQLCGQYLRATAGRHGMLLLVYQHARPSGTWRHPQTDQILTFKEVVTHLEGLASAIRGQAYDAPQPVIGVLDVSSLSEEAARSKSGRGGRAGKGAEAAQPSAEASVSGGSNASRKA